MPAATGLHTIPPPPPRPEESPRRTFPLLLVLCLPASAPAAEKFALKDGDRVVFLGNTLSSASKRPAGGNSP